MIFERRFTRAGILVHDQIAWKTVPARITDGKTGEMIFDDPSVEVPERWSQNATNILAQKYFRKAGVPSNVQPLIEGVETFPGMPSWLQPWRPTPTATFGGERSAHQVFHRMAGCWTHWGWRMGLFTDHGARRVPRDHRAEEQAQTFYDELYWMLANQVAAPNSPQWFNTGLFWAYGIEGPDTGQWYVDRSSGQPTRAMNSYERPQPHACFLSSVDDDLVNEGGIMDLWVREARIFKHGSGSGVNPSRIRAKGEKLSGGGAASGLISFLEVGDRSAGAIQSGGTTRRAAKMICPDVDHPEIEDFIGWKAREEHKAAAIAVGSRVIAERLNEIARHSNGPLDTPQFISPVKNLIDDSLAAGVPQSLIDRARTGERDWTEYDLGWESEAIRTVSGQNGNNSIRVTNAFMAAVETDADWELTARTDGRVMKTVKARELWDKICYNTWASGDPGLLFHDTINKWNTCSADGEIRTVNPCGEYNFLDNTACNLASTRLTAFLTGNMIDLPAYIYVCRMWTVVLDVSVEMASFPSKEFALGAYNYRTLGLGYADLGGLLMRLALPYDSDEARSFASSLTSLMTAVSYSTSAELAAALGPFPRWEANEVPFRTVMEKHREANRHVRCGGLAGAIVVEAEKWWKTVVQARSFRNAQTTLIAPTGTISFVLDCDTTGVEPDFALVKDKALAGGGSMRIVNQAIEPALERLGYDEAQRHGILECVREHGHLPLVAPAMKTADRAVFDCVDQLRPIAHVMMVAAIQPFLSGAASKTANLPNDATVEDVATLYRACHQWGVKAIAPYRDGSKMTQPLAAVQPRKEVVRDNPERFPDKTVPPLTVTVSAGALSNGHDQITQIQAVSVSRGVREALPNRLTAKRFKAKVDGQSLYLIAGEYPDGRLGEIFLELAREGSDVRAWANCFAKAVSIGLQYGVPVNEFVEAFEFTRFEPAGPVGGDDRIKMCTSIPDLAARIVGVEYLGRDDLAHVASIVPVTSVAMPEVIAAMEDLTVGAQETIPIRSEPTTKPMSVPTGRLCPQCHNLSLVRTGTCLSCRNCSYNEGCQ